MRLHVNAIQTQNMDPEGSLRCVTLDKRHEGKCAVGRWGKEVGTSQRDSGAAEMMQIVMEEGERKLIPLQLYTVLRKE